jgi:tRNA-dihydrouridine synthase A
MLARCVSPLPVLWTEMTWDRSLLDAAEESVAALEALVGFSEAEHPIVLQLGGCEPDLLAKAAALGAKRGYDAINLNCGCPAGSRGTRQQCYGARLMLDPNRVAACCAAMIKSVTEALGSCPSSDFISVKCRLGVSGRDEYEQLAEFVTTVAQAGVVYFVVHARQAVLDLNAAANRTVPPLQHDWVFRLIADFPSLRFSINGGVRSVEEAAALMSRGAHGVMVGRGVTADPFPLLSLAGIALGGEQPRSRREVMESYLEYAAKAQDAHWGRGHPETAARKLLSPLANFFHNTPLAAQWRRALSAATAARAELRLSGSAVTITRRCLDATCGATASTPEGSVSVLDQRLTWPM